jgi:hypothetical protein
MSERSARIAAPLLLLAVLAVAVAIRADIGLRLPEPDPIATDRLAAVLDALPEESTVLVGFDPDLGTYAEIRPTARTLVADLAERGAGLAFVSLTPEGRALALGELARLDRLGPDAATVRDLGFVPGAEAALVVLARAVAGERALGAGGSVLDLEEVDLVLVVGGNDLGPRSWVEQVGPRIPGDVPIAAVTPSVLLPEVLPYIESGQLAALISTPREGAAYRESADLGRFVAWGESNGPAALAVLVGLLSAIGFLGAGVGARVLDGLRSSRGREQA